MTQAEKILVARIAQAALQSAIRLSFCRNLHGEVIPTPQDEAVIARYQPLMLHLEKSKDLKETPGRTRKRCCKKF